MRVAIEKIEGVDSVAVSLNEGLADVELKPGNRVDPERIREVVRDSGFTPKTADVRVEGRIAERDGRLALLVRGLGVAYLLVEHPDAKGTTLDGLKSGDAVAVTGRLPESAAKQGPNDTRTLQLYEWNAVGR